jgi:non-specific serine/threonine protein kinase
MTQALIRRRPSELPIEVTGFVGRQTELALLAELLVTSRLATVTEPGGVGKTRVSLRAAATVMQEFADGVCLVELSGLTDPELLPYTVATALGLPEQDPRSQLDVVLDYLRERKLLLILDTCEHLLDACAMLADLLIQASPDVTVLATSRQPLDVPGERTCQIAPLPVPEEEDGTGSGDSVELFAQRATAVVPGFTITDANRVDVIKLCRRLDGIPLAIELAAIRPRAVPLEQLVDRLEDHFRVLTGGRRTALPRHQTLRVAIEWSYNLCSPGEQLLWTRLSVFAGAFDIAAAEEVCAEGQGIAQDEVLELLIGLVDKSVVLRVEDKATRYRLLDSLREFGAERLGDASTIRKLHIARYSRIAGYFGEQLSDDQLGEFRSLRRDHANIRAALEYALALPGAGLQAIRLAADLHNYWVMSGLLREGNYWLTKLLDRFTESTTERARALNGRSHVRSFLGETAGALTDATEAIAVAEAIGDDAARGRGYLYKHLALTFGGSLAEAAPVDPVAAAVVYESQLELADHAGEFRSGRDRGRRRSRSCSDRWGRRSGPPTCPGSAAARSR